MTRRAVSIQLGAPGGPQRRWTLAGWKLTAALAGVFAALAFSGFFIVRFVDLVGASRELERVARRNAELETTVARLAEVESELETMREMDSEIRAWLGLDAPPGVADAAERATDATAFGARGEASSETREGAVAAGASGATDATGAIGASGAAAPNARGASEPADDAALAAIEPPLSPGERAIVAEVDLDARLAIDDVARIARDAQLAWPIEGWVSSEFGEARAGDAPHTGLDIVAPNGTPVLAAADGDVVVAGTDSQYGRLVSIEHADGLRTFYGHNASLLVRRGDRVVRGQQIATVGSTGRSTAPHLHFEARQRRTILDPRALLPPKGDTLAGGR